MAAHTEENNGYYIFLADRIRSQQATIEHLNMRLQRRAVITKCSWALAWIMSIGAGAIVWLY